MLNTLHDGPFSQIKEQGDIHVHHYQKGENPEDKKKKRVRPNSIRKQKK